MTYRSDIAFTPSVKRAQAKRGSRDAYESRMARRDWSDTLPPELIAFIEARDSFYLGTATAEGQPYVQHRGGPPGFIVALDRRTLAFADFAGNRQYLSVGNLDENPRVMLFFMDYPNRRRLKVWGTAEVVEAPEPVLRARLEAAGGHPAERVMLVRLHAWDLNCPKHITPRYRLDELPEAS